MRGRRRCLMLLGPSIAATVFYHPGSALATPAKDHKSTLIAKGRFGKMDISSFFPHGLKTNGNDQLWLSLQETKGIIRRIRAEQCLGTRRKHRLALPPWA